MSRQPTPEEVEEITEVLASGNKIMAIKICREATGKGLKESKEFIDALIPQLIEQDPEKYAKFSKSSGAGCASMFFLCIGLTAGSIALVFRLIA